MVKKPARFVLARHCRLTVSAAFTNVTRFIQRVVNLRGSTYRKGKPHLLALLRPRWTAFLTILRVSLLIVSSSALFRFLKALIWCPAVYWKMSLEGLPLQRI